MAENVLSLGPLLYAMMLILPPAGMFRHSFYFMLKLLILWENYLQLLIQSKGSILEDWDDYEFLSDNGSLINAYGDEFSGKLHNWDSRTYLG